MTAAHDPPRTRRSPEAGGVGTPGTSQEGSLKRSNGKRTATTAAGRPPLFEFLVQWRESSGRAENNLHTEREASVIEAVAQLPAHFEVQAFVRPVGEWVGIDLSTLPAGEAA